MPTEDDLRALFSSAPVIDGVDTARAISRARARRRPRQLVAGAVSGLAMVGIVAVGIQSILPGEPQVATQSDTFASEPAPADEGIAGTTTTTRAPADRLNLCVGALTDGVATESALQLEVAFPTTASVDAEKVEGTVRLINTGSERITGTTGSAPAVTLSQDGTVLWHTNGPIEDIAIRVDLEPGEALEYAASFLPVRCDVLDDQAESFPADLPPLAAGSYAVSAAIDFRPDTLAADGSVALELIVAPTSAIELR